jgi:hypothetical protein
VKADKSDSFFFFFVICVHVINCRVKKKSIPLSGREGPYCCETSRPPHFLDIRLTDDGKVVSFTRRPAILGPLGTSANSDLLYLSQVIVRMENLVE